MFRHISEKMTETMIEQRTIRPEEAELYRYGIGQSLFSLLNVLALLLIGLLSGMLKQTILFYLFYAVLRRFTGGIHAKTPVACSILSDCLLLTVLASLKYLTIPDSVICAVTVLSFLFILFLAPASHPNRKLDAKEICVFGALARAVALAESLFTIRMLYVHCHEVASICMFSIGFAAVFMVLGKLFQHEKAVADTQNEHSQQTNTKIICTKGGLQNDNSESR
jgi:accessory gene regulator B